MRLSFFLSQSDNGFEKRTPCGCGILPRASWGIEPMLHITNPGFNSQRGQLIFKRAMQFGAYSDTCYERDKGRSNEGEEYENDKVYPQSSWSSNAMGLAFAEGK